MNMHAKDVKDGGLPPDPPEKRKGEPERAPSPPARRIITLTNELPVSIVEECWPVVARGVFGSAPADLPSGWLVRITVRQWHQIGSRDYWHYSKTHVGMIIYGKYWVYRDEWDEQPEFIARVGRLVSDEGTSAPTLAKHIVAVGEELRERIAFDEHRAGVIHAVDHCFAALPPRESFWVYPD